MRPRSAEYMKPRVTSSATPVDLRSFLAYLGELGVSQQSQGVYNAVLISEACANAVMHAAPGVDAEGL